MRTLNRALSFPAPKTHQALAGLFCFFGAIFVTIMVTVESLNHHLYKKASFNVTTSSVGFALKNLARETSKKTVVQSLIAPDNESIQLKLAQPEPQSLEDQALNILTRTVKIEGGDTLGHLLQKQGLTPDSIHKIVHAFDKNFSVRQLRPDHEISITYRPLENEIIQLEELLFRPDLERIISVKRLEDGRYVSQESSIQLEKELRRVSGTIGTSLFANMLEKGVPPVLINTLIHAFSYDIDFQRDIRENDTFEVVMERYFDPETGAERAGDILHAQLVVDNKPFKIFYFHPKKGAPGFFNEKGESIQRALLKTPIDGARISSGYGKRKHPVLGYTKMHRGIDFAAPVGTPVMVAGDGIVEKIGRHGSFGNYARIRHANGYGTAYAHLKSFGKNLKAGSRVKQGQIIGYVGMTGRTTGPHLHYEVLKNGSQINPKKMINTSIGGKLTGNDLKAFRKTKETVLSQIANLQNSRTALPKVAALLIGRTVKKA